MLIARYDDNDDSELLFGITNEDLFIIYDKLFLYKGQTDIIRYYSLTIGHSNSAAKIKISTSLITDKGGGGGGALYILTIGWTVLVLESLLLIIHNTIRFHFGLVWFGFMTYQLLYVISAESIFLHKQF